MLTCNFSSKMSNSYIFIAGLHKSGTSILAEILGQHPDIAVFKNTGFPKDEGQFLQTVFPIAKKYGGPGKFGFAKEMHLTEESMLLTPKNKDKLHNEWHRYWHNNKKVFLEKSPPNILKTRFLQNVFPGACFLVITRHPVAVSYATQLWSKTSILELLNHWIKCHEILKNDLRYINNYKLIRYEDFVNEPGLWLKNIFEWLGIKYNKHTTKLAQNTNDKYFIKWQKELHKYSQSWASSNISIMDIDQKVREHGYSLFNI